MAIEKRICSVWGFHEKTRKNETFKTTIKHASACNKLKTSLSI